MCNNVAPFLAVKQRSLKLLEQNGLHHASLGNGSMVDAAI